MVVLMRFSTGESWNEFMYELANSKGYKDEKCIELQTYEDIKARDGVMK